MSEYTVVDLEMNDSQCIEEALKEMGYPIEVFDEPANLVGFQGDSREQKANIIIRRKHVGSASNDVGFLRKADGTYQLIISEYDARSKHSDALKNKLPQLYGEKRLLKQAKNMGLVFTSRKVDEQGRIKIKLMG